MVDEALESFIENVCGDGHLRVEADLGDGFVRLRSAEAERRQAAHDIRATEDIVIEMLRNARDAHAASIFMAATREDRRRRLVMLDDGDGIPSAMHERVFEPRVTSKLDTMHMDKWGVHGRGMALYSIAVNAVSARIAASDVGKGSSFVVETDLGRLGEKTDQSTFPTFERTESGSIAVRGPKNILRTACEFALEHRRTCTVYVGSATDVAATLYAFGLSSLTSASRAFCTDSAKLPVCKRLATAADPASLAEEAARLGLVISERSARRVMDGEIEPLEPLVNRVRIAGEGTPGGSRTERPPKRSKRNGDARGLRVDQADLERFTADVTNAFASLARDYYLVPDVRPEVRVGKEGVRVFIPVEKLL
ncbi:DNA mismatch repair protein [Gordonibacter sp. An230]|uniref:ATP-binding protein n=1 Tax=Gordonibacter sp. An230 TaxID=1965592 RepID=UPI000B391EDF|nr:sensor histidine kinase [Gordonibacter sp. An230]OUO91486.1 DNA mismatch repair protein [Gordonibacter sp. An230]